MSNEQLLRHAMRMRELENKKDALEEALKDVKAQLDSLRFGGIPSLMTELEIKNITYDGLGRVQLASDVHASIREGMKEPAFQWLMDCGHGGLIVETVNSSSLKALARDHLKKGIPMPDEIFNILPFQRASIVKV